MKNFTVIINDTEEKALLTVMVDIQEWLQNAISNRARKAIDTIITEQTDRQPKKMDKATKEQLIQTMVLKTAVEKNAEFEKELGILSKEN